MHRICRPAGERAQVLADRARGVAADAGVDLVEHQQRARPRDRPSPDAVGDAQQRQHHPRELAARGDLAQRAGGQAGVGRDHQLDRVGARGPQPSSRRAARPRTARRASRARPAARGRPRRAPAPRAAALAQLLRPAARSSSRRRRARPRPPRARSRRARARRAARGSARRGASTSAIEPPCLRSQPREQRQALLDLLEAPGPAPSQRASSPIR